MRAFSYAWSLPRSRDKYGGHSIRSAIVKNPMLHAKFMALFFYNRSYCWSKFYIAGCPPPLSLLWPWPWHDDHYIRTWPVFPREIPDVKIWTLYVRQGFRKSSSDRHTGPKLYTTPLRRWSIIQKRLIIRRDNSNWRDGYGCNGRGWVGYRSRNGKQRL